MNTYYFALFFYSTDDPDSNMDVDRFLIKDDFHELITEVIWPWQITYFIIREECFGCHNQTNSNLPSHFIITKEKIKYLFYVNIFWCQHCRFAIYDHYLSDECEICCT